MTADRSSRDWAIEAVDLVKTYKGDVRALDGVSLAVESGTIFGLLGPNGAGKSTTVKILTTLSRADSGSAHVLGVDVARQPDRVRHLIGVVGQHGAVDPAATGRENMLLQGHLYGMSGAELRQSDRRAAHPFRPAEAADRIVTTWSGGHAAQARRGLRPHPPGHACCSWTSPPPASIPRREPICGRRSNASPAKA